MAISAGHCSLIIDGQAESDCTVAFEPAGPDNLGFLSGPPELLKHARSAKQLQVKLRSGEILHVKLLQLSPIGLALVSIIPEL